MQMFQEIREEMPETELLEVEEEYFLEMLRLDGSPTIVFVHGGGGNLWNPYIQLDELKDEYGMLTYNLSGYGESSYRRDQGLQDHVEDLKNLIDTLDLEEVVLHGHSYGTLIAIEYAKKYSPEGLVLTGGGAYDLTPEWEKPMLKALLMLRLYRLPMNKWLMKKLAGKALHPETSEETVDEFLKSNPMPHRRSAWETIVKSFWNYEPGNLEEIESPTLVIHGSEDGIVPAEAAEKTAQKIPDAEYKEFQKSGHLPMAEQPEKYNHALRNFTEENT